jgi:hypothetical protein
MSINSVTSGSSNQSEPDGYLHHTHPSVAFRVSVDIITLPLPVFPHIKLPDPLNDPVEHQWWWISRDHFSIPFVRALYVCRDLIGHLEIGWSRVRPFDHYAPSIATVLCKLRRSVYHISNALRNFRYVYNDHEPVHFPEDQYLALRKTVEGVDILVHQAFLLMLRWNIWRA